MKYNIFKIVIAICLVSVISYSQNVGISTTSVAPDASAMLDITSSNKGLLIPRVALVSKTDLVTIPNPANSLLVYNTNSTMSGGTGEGYYYNAGTSASPNWVRFQQINTGPYFSTGTQYYGTAGSNNWTVPSGITQIRVWLVGGGGGNANTTSSNGGSGGIVSGILDVTPGEILTIVVGAGGTAGANLTTGLGNGGGGTYILRGSTLLCGAGGGGGAAGSAYATNIGATAYFASGYGGGSSFGTTVASLAGGNSSASATNGSGQGGSNCISYLRSGESIKGAGLNNTPTSGKTFGTAFNGGSAASMFTGLYNSTTNPNPGAGASATAAQNGMPGAVFIMY